MTSQAVSQATVNQHIRTQKNLIDNVKRQCVALIIESLCFQERLYLVAIMGRRRTDSCHHLIHINGVEVTSELTLLEGSSYTQPWPTPVAANVR